MFTPDDVDDLPLILSAAEFSVGTGGKVAATDTRVPPLIAGATAAIRRYCGWHIAGLAEQEFTGDCDGSGLIVVPSMRVVSLVSLTVHGVELDVDDVEWSHNGEIQVPSCAPGFRAVTVTVEHGFESAPDVKQIIQQVVAVAISSPFGATREQAGQVAMQWATTAPGVSGGLSLLDRDFQTLDLYRLP